MRNLPQSVRMQHKDMQRIERKNKYKVTDNTGPIIGGILFLVIVCAVIYFKFHKS